MLYKDGILRSSTAKMPPKSVEKSVDTVHNIPRKVRKTGKMSNYAKQKTGKNRIISVKNSCKKYQNNVTSC